MEYIKVKDHSDLVRDPQTQSIINTNKSAYDEYIARRDANNKADQKSQSMEEDLANLKGEIGEIKDLLHQLAQSKYQ